MSATRSRSPSMSRLSGAPTDAARGGHQRKSPGSTETRAGMRLAIRLLFRPNVGSRSATGVRENVHRSETRPARESFRIWRSDRHAGDRRPLLAAAPVGTMDAVRSRPADAMHRAVAPSRHRGNGDAAPTTVPPLRQTRRSSHRAEVGAARCADGEIPRVREDWRPQSGLEGGEARRA